MPKYNIFPKLPLFSYLDRIHVRFRPGSPNSETCRRLLLSLWSPQTLKKFPNLAYTYELLKLFPRYGPFTSLSSHLKNMCSYDERPEIHIRIKPDVSLRFYADSMTLEDLHREIDPYQYNAHLKHSQTRSLESKLDSDD